MRGLAVLVVLWALLASATSAAQTIDFSEPAPRLLRPNPATLGIQDVSGLPPEAVQALAESLANGQSRRPSAPPEDTRTKPASAPAENEPERRAGATSPTEILYRTGYATPLAQKLEQFGYRLFTHAENRAARHAIPGPDYVLGPGDEVVVRISGTGSDRRVTAAVAPDGSLDVPGMGVVTVAGKTMTRAQKELSGMVRGYARGVEVRLSLSRLRDMEVYVLGEVARPGLTLVPAFGTVLSGLYAAGGVPKTGSLRTIRHKRSGQPGKTVDLYRLLLSGDRRADRPLQDGDVVFVPRLGPTAAVAGAVSAPGIYELRNEKKLSQVLKLAGGLLPNARAGHLQVRRYSQEFQIQELAAGAGGLGSAPLHPGDLLEVRPVDSRWDTAVRLAGHVRYPDVFQHRQDLKLSSLLPSAQVLKPGAITDFALLKRYDPATTRQTISTFPLAQVLAKTYDAPLQPRDEVEILARADFGVSEPVSLRGAVRKPGEFEHTPGMTLLDALARAGGLAFGAEAGRIELSRTELVDGQAVTRFRTLDLLEARSLQLEPFDAVFVPGIKDAEAFRYVKISGEVLYPGTYRLKQGQTLADLIRRAGGFTDNAYYYGATFTSERARVVQQKSIDRLVRELSMFADRTLASHAQTSLDDADVATAAQARQGMARLLTSLSEVKAEGRVAITLADLPDFAGSEFDFLLQDGDALVVPPKPSFVSVVGSVYTPSSFLFRRQARVADYLAQAGGTTKNADGKRMYVLKANGEVTSAAQPGLGHGKFQDLRLMPGDTLVVPEDFERIPYLKIFTGVADILFKIATTAGVAVALL